MRFLLAILALLGLLMIPLAASAGAALCLSHGGADASMTMGPPHAAHTVHTGDHRCCDPDGAPTEHDSKSCAQACAAMIVAGATLAADAFATPTRAGRSPLEAAPLTVFYAHAPSGLKRPPRTVA